MERETGIEPVTSSLGSWRSTAELLPLNFVRLPLRCIQDNGHRPCVCLSPALFVTFPLGTCVRTHLAARPAPGVIDLAVSDFKSSDSKMDFELDEITIDDVQKAFLSGQYSSRSLADTTAGSLALVGARPANDAFVAAQLRLAALGDALSLRSRAWIS